MREYQNNPDLKENPTDSEFKFVGPADTELRELETEILSILPFYVPFMEKNQLDDIVTSSETLKIGRLKIYIHEEKQELEK